MAQQKYTDNLISENKELKKQLARALDDSNAFKTSYRTEMQKAVQACAQRDEMQERAVKYISKADTTIADLHKKLKNTQTKVIEKLQQYGKLSDQEIIDVAALFPIKISE